MTDTEPEFRAAATPSAVARAEARRPGDATSGPVPSRAPLWSLVALAAALAALVSLAGLDWRFAFLILTGVTVLLAFLPHGRVSEFETAPAPAPSDTAGFQDRIQDILEAIPDPAILLGHGGMVLHFNAGAGEYYPNLRRGAHFASTIRYPEILEAVTEVGRGRGPVAVSYAERVPVQRRIEAHLAALPQQPGGEAAVLICLRDLTERERIDKMRADFIANASHELRTPLASLAGFIETLQGPARNDPEARERFLDIMSRQAARMSRLIDDLLSLSRVEMNAHLPPRNVVDVVETVRYVADTLDPLAKASGVRLQLDLPPRKILVRGERDELVQVFQNLVQNAIKYGASGKEVGVRLQQADAGQERGARISVSVTDRGPGIAPEHLPRLTERFYRVDPSSSREKGGTGLGLAIVKHVVNRHGGELKIRSEPGNGSTFTIVLNELAAPAGQSEPESLPDAAQ